MVLAPLGDLADGRPCPLAACAGAAIGTPTATVAASAPNRTSRRDAPPAEGKPSFIVSLLRVKRVVLRCEGNASPRSAEPSDRGMSRTMRRCRCLSVAAYRQGRVLSVQPAAE